MLTPEEMHSLQLSKSKASKGSHPSKVGNFHQGFNLDTVTKPPRSPEKASSARPVVPGHPQLYEVLQEPCFADFGQVNIMIGGETGAGLPVKEALADSASDGKLMDVEQHQDRTPSEQVVNPRNRRQNSLKKREAVNLSIQMKKPFLKRGNSAGMKQLAIATQHSNTSANGSAA